MSLPPLPETVLAPRTEPAPDRPTARPWWVPTVGEAAVGVLYVACAVVMVLVFVTMLGSPTP